MITSYRCAEIPCKVSLYYPPSKNDYITVMIIDINEYDLEILLLRNSVWSGYVSYLTNLNR